jgi:hypothetical protein
VSTVGLAIRGMGPYYKIVPHTVHIVRTIICSSLSWVDNFAQVLIVLCQTTEQFVFLSVLVAAFRWRI